MIATHYSYYRSRREGISAAIAFAQTPVSVLTAILLVLKIAGMPGLHWWHVCLPMLLFIGGSTFIAMLLLLRDLRSC